MLYVANNWLKLYHKGSALVQSLIYNCRLLTSFNWLSYVATVVNANVFEISWFEVAVKIYLLEGCQHSLSLSVCRIFVIQKQWCLFTDPRIQYRLCHNLMNLMRHTTVKHILNNKHFNKNIATSHVTNFMMSYTQCLMISHTKRAYSHSL